MEENSGTGAHGRVGVGVVCVCGWLGDGEAGEDGQGGARAYSLSTITLKFRKILRKEE